MTSDEYQSGPLTPRVDMGLGGSASPTILYLQRLIRAMHAYGQLFLSVRIRLKLFVISYLRHSHAYAVYAELTLPGGDIGISGTPSLRSLWSHL